MKFRKKLLKRIAVWGGIPAAVFATYVGLVWSYFQFERFAKNQPDLAVDQAAWYTLLNITDLGAVGVTKLYPQTLEGRLLGLSFIVLSLGLLGVVIGKIGDGFAHLRKQRELGRHGRDTEDHVVIVGWDSFAKLVARELVKSDFEVVVVTEKKSAIDAIDNDAELSSDRVFTIYADPENGEMLRKISIRDASRIFLNCESDTDSLIRLLNYHDILGEGDFEYVIRLRNDELVDHFEFDPDDHEDTPDNSAADGGEELHSRVHTATTQEVAAGLIASYVYEPEAADFQADLIRAASIEKQSFVDDYFPSFTDEDSTDAHSRDSEVEIQQYYVRPDSDFANEKYGDVVDYVEDLFRATRNGRDYDIQQYQLAENCEFLRDLEEPRYDKPFHKLRKKDTMVIGVAKDGDLEKLPDRDTPLEPGDWLVVVTSGSQQSELESLFGNSQGLLSGTSPPPSDTADSNRENPVPN